MVDITINTTVPHQNSADRNQTFGNTTFPKALEIQASPPPMPNMVTQKLSLENKQVSIFDQQLKPLHEELVKAGLMERETGKLTDLGIKIFTLTRTSAQSEQDWKIVSSAIKTGLKSYVELIKEKKLEPLPIDKNAEGPFALIIGYATLRWYADPQIQSPMKQPTTLDKFGIKTIKVNGNSYDVTGWNYVDHFKWHDFIRLAIYNNKASPEQGFMGLMQRSNGTSNRSRAHHYGVDNLSSDIKEKRVGIQTAQLLLNLLFDDSGIYPVSSKNDKKTKF